MTAIVAKTIDGKGMSLASEALDAFRSALRLGVSLPAEPRCEEARTIWNAMVLLRLASLVAEEEEIALAGAQGPQATQQIQVAVAVEVDRRVPRSPWVGYLEA